MDGASIFGPLAGHKSLSAATLAKTLAMIFHFVSPDSKSIRHEQIH
jgi:hypothetical protein